MTAPATYGAGPIKRNRRTKAAMTVLRDELLVIAADIRPATVRGVFYQATSRGLLPKTEQSYKTVGRLLTLMRRDGDLPYGWIADSSRWMRKPDSYDSLASMLNYCQQTYRQAIWRDQEVYVEVWLEKEALAGVLYAVTAKWDVPLMVCKGYPSISFLHGAAEAFAHQDRPAYLYYFGDHDPSGLDINRFVHEKIGEYAPDCDLRFERVAVTPEQIDDLSLQTRPTKKSDSRARGFTGESVEVDAISPDELRRLCDRCITQHIDDGQLQRTLRVENAERETLLKMMGDVA